MLRHAKSLLLLIICLMLPIISSNVAAAKQKPIEGAKNMIHLYEQLLDNPKNAIGFAKQHLTYRQEHSTSTDGYYEGKYNEFDIKIRFKDLEARIDAMMFLTTNPINFKYIIKKMTQKYGEGDKENIFFKEVENALWVREKFTVLVCQDNFSTMLFMTEN